MRMVDLRKGTVYAMNKTMSSYVDLRDDLRSVAKVEYVSAAPAEYDRYRPNKKTNPGKVIVKAVDDFHYRSSRDVTKKGSTITVDAKDILLTWDELEERTAGTKKAADERRVYFENLKALVSELDPQVILDVDHDRYYYSSDDERAQRMIDVRLYTSSNHTVFDPESGRVEMPVELFRKLLQGIKA